MNTSTEHILQCNQSEPLADASGRIVDLMNENGSNDDSEMGFQFSSSSPNLSRSKTNQGDYDPK